MFETRSLKPLGNGGIGSVFEFPTEDGLMALKDVFLEPWNNEYYELLYHHKFEMNFQLRHPNLIEQYRSIMEVSEEGIVHYQIVMELAEYNIVERWNTEGRGTFIRWFLEAAKGLQFMHENNYCHGDVSPFNILIVKNTAKLSDFGRCWKLEACDDIESFNNYAEYDVRNLIEIINQRFPDLNIDKKTRLGDLINFLSSNL